MILTTSSRNCALRICWSRRGRGEGVRRQKATAVADLAWMTGTWSGPVGGGNELEEN